jgi:IS605 OrfB family transposase
VIFVQVRHRYRLEPTEVQRQWLIRENQAVYIEDLNIMGMVRNHRLARAIHDAGWAQFVRLLEEKAERYGRAVHRVFPLVAQLENLLGVRKGARNPAPAHPPVDLSVRRSPRSGPQRRAQHPRRRAGGEAKRLWSRCKTILWEGGRR